MVVTPTRTHKVSRSDRLTNVNKYKQYTHREVHLLYVIIAEIIAPAMAPATKLPITTPTINVVLPVD